MFDVFNISLLQYRATKYGTYLCDLLQSHGYHPILFVVLDEIRVWQGNGIPRTVWFSQHPQALKANMLIRLEVVRC